MSYKPVAVARAERYKISVDEYGHYTNEGYLIVRGLVAREDVEELKAHAVSIIEGRVDVEGVEPQREDESLEEACRRVTRIHMLHRRDEPSERFLLQPRILDVLEALIGPDVLALQTMLFLNAPNTGGQGWHQDSFYITTYPDTLIGTWLALDRADEETGCVWVAPGSNREPIYPDEGRGALVHAEGVFSDLQLVENISNLDDEVNSLSQVAARYGEPVPAIVDPGDVLFFQGHVLHRSHPNSSAQSWRRAFVSHYCNARSWVPWNHGATFEGEAANYLHILARGCSHLPFAQPLFGTECAAAEQVG